MRNPRSVSAKLAQKRAASPLLIAIAMFLALVVAFRIADLCGYLPDVEEADSALTTQL